MEYNSADNFVFRSFVDFFFKFQDKLSFWYFLFPLQCIAVRRLAPIRVLKLLLVSQQWPSFQIQCTLSPPVLSFWSSLLVWHWYNFSTIEALYYLISGTTLSHIPSRQPSHFHRLLFLRLPLKLVSAVASSTPTFSTLHWSISATLPVSVLWP